VVRGTLDLLVLRILATQPMHGWGVMQRLRYLTDDIFQVTTGSLFPALRRLSDARTPREEKEEDGRTLITC